MATRKKKAVARKRTAQTASAPSQPVSATPTEATPTELWAEIRSAGSRSRWVDATLQASGFAVASQDADKLSKKELAEYKRSLKAQAAERRRLNGLAWRAYHATHIVHLGDQIYWNDEDDADKYDHPKADERRKQNRLPEIPNVDSLAEHLGVDIPTLRWLSYNREAAEFVHYSPFTIPKKSGGTRKIWAPMPKLKAAQSWVLRNIAEKLPVHGAAHGFLPGRSILTNAREHTSSQIVVNMDIRDFFPSVTYRRTKGVFRAAGYPEQVATILAALCTESERVQREFDGKDYFLALGPRCLPQGAPTSPALTNTVCLRLDRRLTGLAKKLHWRYTRYADDLTFSLPAGYKGAPNLGNLLGSVRAIVEDEGFEIRPDKTRVARSGSCQKVTGLIVNGTGEPRVPRNKRRMLRAATNNLQQGKPLPDGESIHSLIGWASFLYMTNPEEGSPYLESLGALVE